MNGNCSLTSQNGRSHLVDASPVVEYSTIVTKRLNNNKKDVNEPVKLIADSVVEPDSLPTAPEKAKNPAAVALGRLGGLKGGKARAAKLTKAQRSEIARKAARKRWGYDD